MHMPALLIVLASAGLLVGLGSMLAGYLREGSPRGRLIKAAGVVLIAIMSFAGFPPEGRWDGSNDDGLYAWTAVAVAKEGRAHPVAEAYSEKPGDLGVRHSMEHLLQGQRDGGDLEQMRGLAPGMFLIPQPEEGIAMNEVRWGLPFPPSNLIWLGAAYGLAGFDGVDWANRIPVFGLIMMTVMVAGRAIGALPGLAGGVMLALNPIMQWVGATHFAEPLMGMAWWSALVQWERHRAKGSGIWTTGGWLAVAACAKSEGAVLAILLGVAMAVQLGCARDWRGLRTLLVVLIAALVATGLAYGPVAGTNLKDSVLSIWKPQLALLGLLGLGAWWGIERGVRGRWFGLPPVLFRVTSALGLALLLAWAIWLRPTASTPDFFYSPQHAIEIQSWREWTLIRIGWYTGYLGLGLLIAGWCLAVWRGLGESRSTWWHLAVPFAGGLFLLFCYDIRNTPLQPYCLRRLVPIVFPGMWLLAVAGYVWLAERVSSWHRVGRWGVGIWLLPLILIAAGEWRASQAMRIEVTRQPFFHQLDMLLDRLPEGATIVIDRASRADMLAAPLAVYGGRKVLFSAEGQRWGWPEGDDSFVWIGEVPVPASRAVKSRHSLRISFPMREQRSDQFSDSAQLVTLQLQVAHIEPLPIGIPPAQERPVVVPREKKSTD